VGAAELTTPDLHRSAGLERLGKEMLVAPDQLPATAGAVRVGEVAALAQAMLLEERLVASERQAQSMDHL
jgi:hypothetical protein